MSVERWCIDGSKSPHLAKSMSLSNPCVDVQWSLYSTPCSQKVAFIPHATSVINAGGISLLNDGSGLRIGSRTILCKPGSQNLQFLDEFRHLDKVTLDGSAGASREPTTQLPDTRADLGADSNSQWIFKNGDGPVVNEYCEEGAYGVNLLVVSRRKIPKKKAFKEARGPAENTRRSGHKRHNYSSSNEDSSSYDESRGRDSDAEGPAFSDTNSLKSAASSDDLRPASEDSKSSDEGKNSDNASIGSDSETNDFDFVAGSVGSSDNSESISSLREAETDGTDESDADSLLSAPTSESSDEEGHDRSASVTGGMDIDLDDDYKYPVGITGQPCATGKFCDVCNDDCNETWYHCSMCHSGDYDICHSCIKNGAWCKDQKHQLYEEVSGIGVVSVISWNDFVTGQELLVFDTKFSLESPVFTHSMRESATLHQSAPIVHPKLALVVWPICAEKLLFVDITSAKNSRKKCFYLHPFKASSRKGKLHLPIEPLIEYSTDNFLSSPAQHRSLLLFLRKIPVRQQRGGAPTSQIKPSSTDVRRSS